MKSSCNMQTRDMRCHWPRRDKKAKSKEEGQVKEVELFQQIERLQMELELFKKFQLL